MGCYLKCYTLCISWNFVYSDCIIVSNLHVQPPQKFNIKYKLFYFGNLTYRDETNLFRDIWWLFCQLNLIEP